MNGRNRSKPFDYLVFLAEDSLMDPVHASDPIRPRLVVLWTALVASIAVLIIEYLIASPGVTAPYRIASVLIVIASGGLRAVR